MHVLDLLRLFFNGNSIEAQSAGLFLPCKWFPFIAPRFVKMGVNGSVIVFLCLFIPAQLSDVNAEVTETAGKELEAGRK